MRIRGLIIGGASTAFGLGLGLLAAQSARSAPAKAEAPPAAPQAHVQQDGESEITIDAKPEAVVAGKKGKTRIRYGAKVHSKAKDQSAAGLTLEILEPNYRPVFAEDGPVGRTNKGRFDGSLQTPEGLQDGLYMARIWAAASDGTKEDMEGVYQYFEVVGGNASPVTYEDYLARNVPMSAWSYEDRELTEQMIEDYKKRQELGKKEQEALEKAKNSGRTNGGSGL